MKAIEQLERQRDEFLAKHQAAVVHLQREMGRCQRRLSELQQEVPEAIERAALAGAVFENWARLTSERNQLAAFLHDAEPVLAALRSQLDSRQFEQQIRVAGEQYRRMEELQETIRTKMDSARESSVGTHHVARYIDRLRDIARRLEEQEACEQFLGRVGWNDEVAAA